MENQHRKIKGYRELNQEEIDLMNKVKALGPALEEVMGEVAVYLQKQSDMAPGLTMAGNDYTEAERLASSEPRRWFAMAKSDLQVGLMKLTRSIAQPSFF